MVEQNIYFYLIEPVANLTPVHRCIYNSKKTIKLLSEKFNYRRFICDIKLYYAFVVNYFSSKGMELFIVSFTY